MSMFTFAVGLISVISVVASNPVRGLGRWLAPDTIAIVMLFMIFGIRPLFVGRFSERTIYGYTPTDSGEQTALTVGVVCMGAFAVGTFFASRSPKKLDQLASRSPSASGRLLNISARQTLLIAFGSVGVYLAIIFVLAGPRVISALGAGRSADPSLTGVPELVLLFPMGGSLAAALFLMSRRGVSITRTEGLLLLTACVTSIVLLSQLGNRRFLIPGVLIPVIALLMRRSVRLRLVHVALAFGAFLFIAIIPMVRSAGARLPGETLLTATARYLGTQGIGGVLSPVFASYDTEMLDYIGIAADRIQGASAPGFGAGRGTFVEFLTRPLPGLLHLPTPYSDALLTSIYGGGCGDPVCPVASVGGVLYFDGGVTGVLLGSILFGIGLRWLSVMWVTNKRLTPISATIVAIFSAFALIMTRTNTIHAIWWAIYASLLSGAIYFTASKVQAAAPNTSKRRPLLTRSGRTTITQGSSANSLHETRRT